jgi:hypothetical protein
MADRVSTSRRLCSIFCGQVVSAKKAGAQKALYVIVETVIVAPVVAFFDVLKVLDVTGE